jgi:soluble lytic murein transglycosylase-like protein
MKVCFILAGVLILFAGSARTGIAAGPGLRATSVVKVDSRTGRLVRRLVAPSLKAGTADAQTLRKVARVDRIVEEAARKHGVDPLLIHSVIQVESNYNPFAVSHKGAEGLMQLIPATAKRFGIANSFNPEQNIDAGVRYLKYLQSLFDDERLVLAAYNAGEGAVAKHQRIPPYRETQDYIVRVGKRYAELKREAEGQNGSSLPEGSGYRAVESFVDSEGRLHLRTR